MSNLRNKYLLPTVIQALYTSSFDDHPYYKTKKLAAKYVNK
ncbi:hypothetical protein [Lactobacillus acetotolerans]|nr:hypothetical protein [Lactobacillus acetotolerans]